VENARLGQDLETQKLNLADINEFLTSELDKTTTKLVQLEDRAGKLQQELDDLKESHVVGHMTVMPTIAQTVMQTVKTGAVGQ